MNNAIIMAGGRSLRMRASSGGGHKALVKVLGLSMLERNLLTLLSHGFQNIFVAIGAGEQSLLTFARGRARQMAGAANAHLHVVVEKRPLGTIGAARAIHARLKGNDLLVVNVDNLTSLDLSALLNHHQTGKPAMTIATHIEPFRVPFGQVVVRKGVVVEYREKPTLPVRLSSGVYVLGTEARLRIPPERPCGAPELVQTLLGENKRVEAFRHRSPWIDVNDAASVAAAEELIAENFTGFELSRQSPASEVVVLCVISALSEKQIAIFDNRKGGAGRRRPPASTAREAKAQHKSGGMEQAAIRLLEDHSLRPAQKPRVLASFDELAPHSGARTRYHLFVVRALRRSPEKGRAARKKIDWVNFDKLSTIIPKSSGGARTIAYLRRYFAS